MKKIALLLAMILSVVAFASCKKDSKDEYLVVATNAYFPPFEYYVGHDLSGVDMQIAYLLADKMGKKLQVLDEEFGSIFTSVANGEALLGMAGITINETRKLSYDFSKEYYESAQVLLVKVNDSTFDTCENADDCEAILKTKDKDYVVGTQSGTTGYMYSFGDEGFGYDGFTNLTTKGFSNGALAAQDLVNNKLNAVIIDKQPALMIAKNLNANGQQVKVIDIELTAESYAYCIKKGDTATKAIVDELLDALSGDGYVMNGVTYTLDGIINSFFDGTSTFKYTNPKA